MRSVRRRSKNTSIWLELKKRNTTKSWNNLSNVLEIYFSKIFYQSFYDYDRRDHPDCKTTSLRAKTADPPTVPTPYNLYCDANMKKLMDKGMSRNDARLSCKESFKSLSDKKKLHWIDLSLAQEKNYMVTSIDFIYD